MSQDRLSYESRKDQFPAPPHLPDSQIPFALRSMLAQDRRGIFLKLRELGPVASVSLGLANLVGVTDIPITKEALNDKTNGLIKGNLPQLIAGHYMGSDNIVFAEFENWVSQRKALSAHTQPAYFKKLDADIRGHIQMRLAQWSKEGSFDLAQKTKELTPEVTSFMLMSTDLGEKITLIPQLFKQGEISPAVKLLQAGHLGWIAPHVPAMNNYLETRREVYDMFQKIIDVRTQQMGKSLTDGPSDILADLIRWYHDGETQTKIQEGKLSPDILLQNVVTMYVASGTTASVLANSLIMAELNPTEKMRLLESTQRDHDSYTRAFATETARKLTPAHLIFRAAGSDGAVVGGHYVKPESNVIFAVDLMHADDRFFPQADKFKPGRDIEGDPDYQSDYRTNNLSFGFGPRVCLGKELALLVTEIANEEIHRDYNVVFDEPEKLTGQLHYATTGEAQPGVGIRLLGK